MTGTNRKKKISADLNIELYEAVKAKNYKWSWLIGQGFEYVSNKSPNNSEIEDLKRGNDKLNAFCSRLYQENQEIKQKISDLEGKKCLESIKKE